MHTPRSKPLVRLPLLALAGLSLLAALWAALARVGWRLPALPLPIVAQHGALMVSGFLGTLIALERAVALGWRWTYAAPLFSGLGALALLTGLPPALGHGLLALGALGLTALFAQLLRTHRTLFVAMLGLGALLWLAGNLLWWAGRPLAQVTPWWAGFLVLTIAGERLELARVLMLRRAARTAFLLAVGVLLAGLALSLWTFDPGLRLAGLGMLALGLWLLRNDLARRTIRQRGLTRFIAACLLPGYLWLMAGGALWLAPGGGHSSGPLYDAMLHRIVLGFVISMIFGHAPLILPAVLGKEGRPAGSPVLELAYRPAFYVHLALLHGSLLLRVAGDLSGGAALRRWGGLLNVLALLLFLAMMARSVRRK